MSVSTQTRSTAAPHLKLDGDVSTRPRPRRCAAHGIPLSHSSSTARMKASIAAMDTARSRIQEKECWKQRCLLGNRSSNRLWSHFHRMYLLLLAMLFLSRANCIASAAASSSGAFRRHATDSGTAARGMSGETVGIPRRACDSCGQSRLRAKPESDKTSDLMKAAGDAVIVIAQPKLVDFNGPIDDNASRSAESAGHRSAQPVGSGERVPHEGTHRRTLIFELPFRCRMGRFFPHVRDFVDLHGAELDGPYPIPERSRRQSVYACITQRTLILVPLHLWH